MRWDWKAVIGLIISAVLIWWVLRGVDLVEVWDAIRHARWGYLFAAIAVATSGFAVRAGRWKLLLQPMCRGTRFGSRFAAVNIGFASNNLLPARVGEFARAWTIARLEPVSTSGALGSLVIERFLDAIAVFGLLAAAVLHPSFPAGATVAGRPVGVLVWGVLGLIGTLFAIILLLLVVPHLLFRVAEWVAARLPARSGTAFLEVLRGFLEGLESLRDPRLLVPALVWSFGFWAWNAVSFWLAFLAFGIDQGYVTALFVQGIIAFGVAVPSAPGFFGTFHAAAVVGLHEVYGAGQGATLAFAFGYHLGGFIPVTSLGLWYAGRLGMTLQDMREAEEHMEERAARGSAP